MSIWANSLLSVFTQWGPLGLFVLSIAADSFLFLPIGSDLLIVILIARYQQAAWICVLAAALGSTVGVWILDLVCRKGGEAGLKRFVRPKQLDRLKKRFEKNGAIALVLACLAPPPFPFTAYIAFASAFQYPRPRLLALVVGSRTVRYVLVAWASIHFGSRLLAITKSKEFTWFIYFFVAICVLGSIWSVYKLVRSSGSQREPAPARSA